MISKHPQDTVLCANFREQEAQLAKRGSKRTVSLHPEVASKDAHIGGSLTNYLSDFFSQAVEAVEMQVGKKQDFIAVKRRRQVAEVE